MGLFHTVLSLSTRYSAQNIIQINITWSFLIPCHSNAAAVRHRSHKMTTWFRTFYHQADRERSLQGRVRHPAGNNSPRGDRGGHREMRWEGISPIAMLSVAGQRALIRKHRGLRVCRREGQPLHLNGRRKSEKGSNGLWNKMVLKCKNNLRMRHNIIKNNTTNKVGNTYKQVKRLKKNTI